MNKKLVKLTILSSILAAISACSNSGIVDLLVEIIQAMEM